MTGKIFGRAAAALCLTVGLLVLSGGSAWAASGGYTDEQWRDFGFRAMNFAVFFIILFVLLKKPLTNFFRGRREHIARTLEYLETQAHNLTEQTELLNKQMAEIASEREAVLDQYERMGQKERDRIIAEANEAAEQIVRKARLSMEQEISEARRLLMAEMVELSTKMAADLIKGGIGPADHRRLSEEFMKQVENLKPAVN